MVGRTLVGTNHSVMLAEAITSPSSCIVRPLALETREIGIEKYLGGIPCPQHEVMYD